MQVVRDVVSARKRWGEEIQALHGSPDRQYVRLQSSRPRHQRSVFSCRRADPLEIEFRTGVLALEEKPRSRWPGPGAALSNMRELQQPAQIFQQALRRRRLRHVTHHQIPERVDDINKGVGGRLWLRESGEQLRAGVVVAERDGEIGMLRVEISPVAAIAGSEKDALNACHV